jgi:hypothetical protein
MYGDLYQYLILYEQLSLPGIGTFNLERKPATADFPQKLVYPPSYTITFHQNNEAPVKRCFHWLAGRLNIPYHEAIVRFNGFAYDLKNQLMSGNKITWDEVGVLSKSMAGEVKFEPVLKDHRFDRPVNAVRLIREKAEHNVRVGEEEKTSTQMTEWLNQGEGKKSYYRSPAWIAVILLIIFTGIYFMQRGFSASSAANQQKVSPQKETVTHTKLQ